MIRCFRVLVAVALVFAACAKRPTTATPPWQVSGGFIRDSAGRAVTLRGMCVSGNQKSPPYFDIHTPADYVRMRQEWGFNSIRFLMVWAAIEPEEGQYDQAYLDGLAERMEWAQQAGLQVILDMHQDIYGEGFGFDGAPRWACNASYYESFVPNGSSWSLNAINPDVEACTDQLYTNPTTVAHFTEAWRQVAARLANSPAVIGFDLLNEPEWGTYDIYTFEHDRLEPFYEHIVPVIRAEAPQWLAFLEPGTSRNLGFPTSLVPFPFGNVVYSPHSYDTTAEQSGMYPVGDTPAVISNLAALESEATSLNAALWIGEYGGVATDPTIADYMNAQYTGIGAMAGGSDYWDYDFGGGYSPLNSDGSEREPLMDSIIRPYPEYTAGDPVSYAFDPTSSTFTFVYKPDPSISDPTIINIAPRLYPNGYSVSCGGCAWQAGATGLTISEPGSGTESTVTIQPR